MNNVVMVRLIRGEWLEWGAVTARLCVKHASVGGLEVCLFAIYMVWV